MSVCLAGMLCCTLYAMIMHDQVNNHIEFVEIPSSLTIETGSGLALFRCRHMSPEAFILWRVNGSSPGQYPTGSINENSARVYTH